MLQISHLKSVCAAIILGGLLTSCLIGQGGSESVSSTPWASNVQDWYFLKSASGGEIMRSDSSACGDDINFDPVRFRLRGDSLDLGFPNYTLTWSDTGNGEWDVVESSDTIYFGGTYSRVAGASGSLYGSWKLADHRPWDATSAGNPRLDTLEEDWNFLYADEEMRITPRLMTFAYPTVRLPAIRLAEYMQREDPDLSFDYVGRDSVRIFREDILTTITFKPFKSISARTNYPGRDPVNVSLADSCDFPSAVIDSTWIYRALWNIEDDLEGEEFEKIATGRHAVRFHRGR